MEQLRVGIFIEDAGFEKALARGLSLESRNMTFIIIRGCLDGGSQCHMVLTDFKNDLPAELCVPVEICLKLSDDEDSAEIYKYEDSRTIVNKLIFAYYEMTGRLAEYRGNSSFDMIVFAEVSGGNGVTAAAIATARMLNIIYGYRCLYINLCPIDDSKRYFEEHDEAGMLKFLYYLNKDEDFPIETFIAREDGVDTLKTRAVNKYSLDINDALLNKFFKIADKLGKYDYLIVDAGNYLSREKLKLLNSSDCLILVSKEQDGQIPAYTEKIREEIEKHAGEAIIQVGSYADDDESDNDIILISKDKTAFIKMGGRVTIDLNGNYGLDIARLAKRVVEVCNGRSNKSNS